MKIARYQTVTLTLGCQWTQLCPMRSLDRIQGALDEMVATVEAGRETVMDIRTVALGIVDVERRDAVFDELLAVDGRLMAIRSQANMIASMVCRVRAIPFLQWEASTIIGASDTCLCADQERLAHASATREAVLLSDMVDSIQQTLVDALVAAERLLARVEHSA
jgi:hypothetical protein